MTNPPAKGANRGTSKCISKCLWIMLIASLLCVFSYCAYFIYFSQTPSAPTPDGANLISRSPRSSAMHAYWYYENYVVNIPEEDAIAFYQKRDAKCSEVFVSEISIPAPFTRCYLGAKPFGDASVSIFRKDNQTYLSVEVSWEPADTRIGKYFN